jgi:predicted amidohydrolase YtcJ
LILGSGWPAHSLNPLLGLDRVVNAPREDMTNDGLSARRTERLPLKQAIDAYTASAAWSSFDDQRKGSILPGMLADLVVLSDDIFAGPTTKLSTTSVAVTIFDGKIVYQRVPRSETEPAPALSK